MFFPPQLVEVLRVEVLSVTQHLDTVLVPCVRSL